MTERMQVNDLTGKVGNQFKLDDVYNHIVHAKIICVLCKLLDQLRKRHPCTLDKEILDLILG